MLIESITVENFLPFQGKQRVEFSTDPEKNVTLIMGNNGAGKTSLAQAFEWCLYGHAPKDSVQVINAYVRDHIASGCYRYASVEIDICKDDMVYTISRKQKYSRNASGNMEKPGQHEFAIMYKENGETKQVAVSDRPATINKLLSDQLSHYFFFDGEHVKNMRAEIEHGKSSDFAEAVKSILGLQPISSALGHLKSPGNRLSVERWFNRRFDLKGDQDLGEKTKRIETLEKGIERNEEDKEIAEADVDAAKDNVAKYQQLLRENEASEEAQRDVDRAKRQYGQAKSAYLTRRNDVFKRFKDQHYRFFVERPIRDAKKALEDEDKISKGIPSVDDKTIKFLLEQHECLCGRKFETGDDVFQHLTDLLSYVPPKDLGTYISEFDRVCGQVSEDSVTLQDDLSEAFRAFRSAEASVDSSKGALEKAQAYLDGLNNVDVKLLKKNRDDANRDYERAVGRVEQARRSISNAKSEIERIRAEIKAYSVKNAKNKEIQECMRYVDYIYDFLHDFYSKQENETRNQLKDTVNKFFTEMYNGELHLELDENYGVTVTVDNIDTSNEAWKTSSGQTLAIILAFILGILDIAKNQNKDEDSELLKGDTYPLVMDAPLSDFDKTRIGTICNLLPSVAEQVIIIIKDTDGTLAEEHMAARIGRRYTIEGIRDYESIIKE